MKIKIIYKTILIIIIFGLAHLSAMEMIIQGNIDETYDDNINLSVDNTESDMLTNIMLGITASSELRKIDIDFSGNIYQRISFKNREQNQNFQDLRLVINKSFSDNLIVNITEIVQHYPETRSFDVLFGRNESETGYLGNFFSSGLTAYVTSSFFCDLGYNNTIMNNDSDLMSDSVLHNPFGAVGCMFNARNTVKVGYLYQLIEYDNGQRIRGDGGYAEYEKCYTRRLRSILVGGYDYFESPVGQTLSTRWRLTFIDDLDINNQLNLSFAKENTISNIYNDIYDNWRFTGHLNRQIGDRSAINISLFYGEGMYQIRRIIDKLLGLSLVYEYIVTEFVNFRFGYQYTRSSMINPGMEELVYDRNQISFGLSAVY